MASWHSGIAQLLTNKGNISLSKHTSVGSDVSSGKSSSCLQLSKTNAEIKIKKMPVNFK
jgi:hypothetical protein